VDSLDAYGQFTKAEISAMGAILQYLEITQKGKLPLLRPPLRETEARTVQIDTATRRNLELTQALTGGRAGSLLAMMDRTVTAGGARLLERRLSSPSRVLDVVQDRLDAVAFGVTTPGLRGALRERLREVPDMDRALSRLALDRGGPRDLAAIRNGLDQARALQGALGGDLPPLLAQSADRLGGHDTLIDLLTTALVEHPPLLARDGGFIAAGFDTSLDEARQLQGEGRSVIARMQQEFIEITGIASLKIKHNNVLGYFIETTSTHAQKMLSDPLSDTFIHRQTTANQVRFTTVKLSELETRILNAGNHGLELEKRHFDTLRSQIIDQAAQIGQTAAALAEFDLTMALAELAAAENWQRPKVDNSRAFAIESGRHPVVEHALRANSGDSFIANDCDLSGGDAAANIWLLTGPNMAGKSTFLRQNALIALLAQTGSYVPARRAHIGLVSQIFSRVGASDDLARGRSTFMVEMVETAAILNQADDRALVILDEIGRGTATYDGLSIAWATLEHLHDVNRTRALFATHYHEMTALATRLDGVENATVAVKEWDGQVIFLHEVHKGAADRSYGVQVAQLAGLPARVITRARVVLDMLEQGDREGTATKANLIDDLPLFAAQPPAPPASTPSQLETLLRDIHPDDLSPKDALALIYTLKDTLDS
jgi:DNA mismatch repair protein MutS